MSDERRHDKSRRSRAPGRRGPLVVECPTCGTRTVYEGNPHRPFCSERCQIIDRANWASEAYTIPSEDAPGLDDGEE